MVPEEMCKCDMTGFTWHRLGSVVVFRKHEVESNISRLLTGWINTSFTMLPCTMEIVALARRFPRCYVCTPL
jgi:hypothetical protein